MFKFGPEWIRTMSNDGTSNNTSSQTANPRTNIVQSPNSQSVSASPPQFAEYRYGREELLSLYEREISAPEELLAFSHVYVRRRQPPLALLDNCQEATMDSNQRHWVRQNSAPVAAPGNGTPPQAVMGSRSSDPSGHVSRGGRGRGRLFQPGQNTVTYHNSRLASRAEDTQSSYADGGRSFYASWHDRGNPPLEPGSNEWNNQRREVTQQPSHTNRYTDWRRPGINRNIQQEDGDDTRRAATQVDLPSAPPFRNRPQGSGPGTHLNPTHRYSWRGKDDHFADTRFDRERPYNEREWSERNSRERGPRRGLRSGWSGDYAEENSLPEWAVESTTADQASGSFDSSGAFYSPMKSGGGDELLPSHNTLMHSQSHSSFMSHEVEHSGQTASGLNHGALSRSLTQSNFDLSKKVQKKRVSFANVDNKTIDANPSEPTKLSSSVKTPVTVKNKQFDVTEINFKKVTAPLDDNLSDNPTNKPGSLDWWSPGAMFVTAKSKQESPQAKEISQEKEQDFLIDKPFSEISTKDVNNGDLEETMQSTNEQIDYNDKKVDIQFLDSCKEMQQAENMGQNLVQKIYRSDQYPEPEINSQQGQGPFDYIDNQNITSVLLTSADKSLREQHQNFIQLKETCPLPDFTKPPPNIPVRDTHNESLMHERDLFEMLRTPVTHSGEETFLDNFIEKGPIINQPMPQTTMNILSQSQQSATVFPQSNPQMTSSLDSENIWFYQDPQGKIQGPFDANHMKLWYKKGYFDEFLLVKRLCDPVMIPLGNFGSTPPFMQDTNSPPTSLWNQGFPGEANVARNDDDFIFNQQQMGHVNQFPVTQPTLNELLFRNMVLENSARNDDFLMRQQQQRNVMNVNTSSSPMAAAPIQMFERPSQVMDIFQSPLENTTISGPVDQTPVNPYPQPPRDDGLILASDDEPRAPALWREFQQNLKSGKTSWDADYKHIAEATRQDRDNEYMKAYADRLRHYLLERATPPQTSTLPHTTALPHPSVVPHAALPHTSSAQPFYNIWNNYESSSSLFDKHESHLKQPAEDVIPMPNSFQQQQLFAQQNRPQMYDEQQRTTENSGQSYLFNKFDLVPQELDQNFTAAQTVPSEDVILLQKIDDYLGGFQKVITKKEEKQIKMQKHKEAKKKADEIRKLEEQPALAPYKIFDEYFQPHQRNISNDVPRDPIQEIQKQRTAKIKSAPWSAVAALPDESDNKLISLSEIQKLEREKKIEQVREQETTLQQSAAKRQILRLEQEAETSPGWLKLATASPSSTRKTLTEIQTEELHQVQTAAKDNPPRSFTPRRIMTRKHPSTGFWESTSVTEAQRKLLAVFEKAASPVHVPAKKQEKAPQSSNNSALPKTTKAKPEASNNSSSTKTIKAKPAGKKTKSNPQPTLTTQEKNDGQLPFENFDKWCAEELNQWKHNIDIPTFISFLKDIESPDDVKDYVKSVTGETPEAYHFIDQYLHKRSRILGQSNDGEGTSSGHNSKYTNEFQEVKGKNKKAKNKKMFKVDSRILGFSTTASVDRINIGELDSV